MVEQHDTTNTPSWSAPRLIALGAAQASQNGATSDVIENASYYPISV
jgi:hypothetical protein